MPVTPPAHTTLPLRDIHLPEPVGWWPPALGWWLLLGLLLLATIGLVFLWRRRQGRRYRRLALAELEGLAQLPPAELAAGLSQLLRQAALCYFPAQECAGLWGEDWLRFLDRPFNDQPFSQGIGRALLDAPYRPEASVDGPALLDLGRRWLKRLPPRRKAPRRGR